MAEDFAIGGVMLGFNATHSYRDDIRATLQSPSGTYVNDQKVEGRTALERGDVIRVGKSAVRFNERKKNTGVRGQGLGVRG